MLSDLPWTKVIKLVALSLCGVGTCPGITLDDYSRLKNTAMMVFFIVKVSLPLCSFEDIESPRAGFQGSPSAGSSVAKPCGPGHVAPPPSVSASFSWFLYLCLSHCS